MSRVEEENKEMVFVFWENLVPVVDGVHKWTQKKKYPKTA